MSRDLDRLADMITARMQINSPPPMAVTPAPAALPVEQTGSSSSIVDIFFRGLIAACAAGVGWLVITLPVLTDNVKDLQSDMETVQRQTKDTLTRQDIASMIQPIEQRQERNTSRVDSLTTTLSDLRGRVIRLEEHSDERGQ